LKEYDIQISMDGTGRWRDNVFVERLWRSLKYEEVYLQTYETVYEAQEGLAQYLTFYTQVRPHRALEGRTPENIYNNHLPTRHVAG
jgi:putative transposase